MRGPLYAELEFKRYLENVVLFTVKYEFSISYTESIKSRKARGLRQVTALESALADTDMVNVLWRLHQICRFHQKIIQESHQGKLDYLISKIRVISEGNPSSTFRYV